jgi:hypothetical protein
MTLAKVVPIRPSPNQLSLPSPWLGRSNPRGRQVPPDLIERVTAEAVEALHVTEQIATIIDDYIELAYLLYRRAEGRMKLLGEVVEWISWRTLATPMAVG